MDGPVCQATHHHDEVAQPSRWIFCYVSFSLGWLGIRHQLTKSTNFLFSMCKMVLFSPTVGKNPWVIFLENVNITKNMFCDWLLSFCLASEKSCSVGEEKLLSHFLHAVFQALKLHTFFSFGLSKSASCESNFGDWANEFEQRQFPIMLSGSTGPFDLHFTPLLDWTMLFYFGISNTASCSMYISVA